MRDPLRENKIVQAEFMVVFDTYLYEPHASEHWRKLAQTPRADFEPAIGTPP